MLIVTIKTIMLNVRMLSVVMLNVVAPQYEHKLLNISRAMALV
jgi:hypothetical protein